MIVVPTITTKYIIVFSTMFTFINNITAYILVLHYFNVAFSTSALSVKYLYFSSSSMWNLHLVKVITDTTQFYINSLYP